MQNKSKHSCTTPNKAKQKLNQTIPNIERKTEPHQTLINITLPKKEILIQNKTKFNPNNKHCQGKPYQTNQNHTKKTLQNQTIQIQTIKRKLDNLHLVKPYQTTSIISCFYH